MLILKQTIYLFYLFFNFATSRNEDMYGLWNQLEFYLFTENIIKFNATGNFFVCYYNLLMFVSNILYLYLIAKLKLSINLTLIVQNSFHSKKIFVQSTLK